jgi:hypothetical protein
MRARLCETDEVTVHNHLPNDNFMQFLRQLGGNDNHDSDNFAKRPNTESDELNDDDDDFENAWKRQAYDEPEPAYVPQSKPQAQVKTTPMIRPASFDSDLDIPNAPMRESSEVSPDQGMSEQAPEMNEHADLDRIFGNVGGYGNASSPSKDRKSRPQKSIWKSIGGGISRFAKGMGGLVKNLSGYNLLRHGLIGANYNRGQVKKNTAKRDEALAQLNAHNDPKTQDARRAEMGIEAFKMRGAELNSAFMKYDQGIDKSRIALMDNRSHYTGYHMANNFKRAFSDGNYKPGEAFTNFLGAGFARRKLRTDFSDAESDE